MAVAGMVRLQGLVRSSRVNPCAWRRTSASKLGGVVVHDGGELHVVAGDEEEWADRADQQILAGDDLGIGLAD